MHEHMMMNHKKPQLCQQQEYVLYFPCNYFSVLYSIKLTEKAGDY